MVVQTYNLSIQKLRQEDHKLEANWGYRADPVSELFLRMDFLIRYKCLSFISYIQSEKP